MENYICFLEWWGMAPWVCLWWLGISLISNEKNYSVKSYYYPIIGATVCVGIFLLIKIFPFGGPSIPLQIMTVLMFMSFPLYLTVLTVGIWKTLAYMFRRQKLLTTKEKVEDFLLRQELIGNVNDAKIHLTVPETVSSINGDILWIVQKNNGDIYMVTLSGYCFYASNTSSRDVRNEDTVKSKNLTWKVSKNGQRLVPTWKA